MLRHVHSKQRICRLGVLSLVCWLVSVGNVAAQGESGVIAGTIKDAQGGALPGVSVTLRNVETGQTRSAVSEADGTYRLAGLLPGSYDLTAELSGFANGELKALTITIGLELQRDITMALQGLQETLTVTGEAPVVETTSTAVAQVVTQEQIDSLPIANRQPINLALLLPGTTMDTTTTRRSQASVGAGGSSNVNNVYYVDGGLNMLYNSGQQFLEVPQSAIREFKVNINQASAQYGAVGGVLLTATKSGTNRFSGEAFEFFRDDSLNAYDKLQKERHDQFGEPKPEYRRNSYGFALGGPIVRDRLHFFFAFSRSLEPNTKQTNTGQPQFYSAVEGSFPSSYERRAYFARGDFQINAQQNVFSRYAYDKEYTLCEDCGGTNGGFFGTDTHSPRDSMLVAHTWVISPRILNEIRSQVPPSHLENLGSPPGLPKWPSSGQGEFPPERFNGYTPVYNFPSLAWGANQWSNNRTNRWDISDDVSLHMGSHDWKLGGAYMNFDSLEEQANNIGNWTFRNDQYFNPDDPASLANLTGATQFTASFPPLPRHLENHWIQWYVQDDWRVRSNVTVNLGLRYDNQYKSFNNQLDLTPVPQLKELIDPTTRGDHDNFGPRAGFAWDLRNDGRSVVRGAYGISYQYVMAAGQRPEMTALRQTSIVINNPSYPDPYGGRGPESFASTAPPNVNVLDDNIRNARSKSFTLGYSQELKANLALHVDGDFANVEGVTMTNNINTPDPVTGLRPRPTWGRIIQLQSTGEHKYRGLFVRLEKRYSNRHQYLLSYTLSKANNFGMGTQPQFTDFYNPGLDWGPGSADRRQAFVASGSMLLKYDINVGAVWTLRSTRPFSARAGIDLNRDGVTVSGQQTDYVPGTTRNVFNRGNNAALLQTVNAWRTLNGRAPISESQIDTNDFNQLDVRVGKAIVLGGSRKVEFIAQVFNLLGRDNLGAIEQGWVENALSDSFGRILTVFPRQQAELAIRFSW
jgi:Carboxypeptidase regulatory-like domain